MRVLCPLPTTARHETAAATDAWLSSERTRSARLLVHHEPHRRVRRCAMCHRRLDTADPWSMDCGGDCLQCVRETEDWAKLFERHPRPARGASAQEARR